MHIRQSSKCMEILQEDVSVAGCDSDKYALGKIGQLHIKGPFHQS